MRPLVDPVLRSKEFGTRTQRSHNRDLSRTTSRATGFVDSDQSSGTEAQRVTVHA